MMSPCSIVVSKSIRPLARDRHPAYVYLARLAPGSRRTMGPALTVVAALFNRTPDTLDWAALRY